MLIFGAGDECGSGGEGGGGGEGYNSNIALSLWLYNTRLSRSTSEL